MTQNPNGKKISPTIVANQFRGRPKEVEGSKIENKLLITFNLEFVVSSLRLSMMCLGC